MPSLGSIPPGKGAKKRVLRRYLKVKATKPEERGGRESERSRFFGHYSDREYLAEIIA
jgi:hypothetical protein